MKNSVLSRFISIFLCVLAIVSLAAAGMGILNTYKEAQENQRTLELLKERTIEYENVLKELEGKPSYSKFKESLDEAQSEHDKAVSKHKTELAEFSATKGGIISGKEQLRTTYDALLESDKQLTAFEAMLPQMESGLAYARQQGEAAAEQYFNSSVFPLTIQGIDNSFNKIDDIKSYISTCKESLHLETDSTKIAQYNSVIEILSGTVATLENNLSQAKATGAAQAESEFYKQLNSQLPSDYQGMTIDELKSAVSEARAKIQFGYDSVSLGNFEITKLEKELPEREDKLNSEIEPLEREAEELEKLWTEADNIKNSEKELNSLKAVLLNNSNIKLSVDNGNDLIESSNEEINRRTVADEKNFKYRFLSNIFLITSSVLVFLAVPAVFEKFHSKFFVFVPYIFSLLLSILSNYLSIELERGLMYSALSLSIFTFIQLLILLPQLRRNKL